MSPRARVMLVLAAVLSVIVPYLFWMGTWFGRKLTDLEIEAYLHDSGHPRKIQHALSQLAGRMGEGDSVVTAWYPEVAALARNPLPELRTTAAWVMGQDNRSQAFHRALLGLLGDADVTVRRNAALALVRFGDDSGREELARILASDKAAAEAPETWEALRGLYFVGRPEDLPAVKRYEAALPDRIRRQAALTAQAIRRRSERGPTR